MSPTLVGVLIFQTSRWNPTHMSDAAWLGLIGLATVIVAAVPATVTAFTTRHLAVQARDHAKDAADAATEARDTLGTKNGNGDAMQMLARVLGLSTELVHSQERSAAIEQELLRVQKYAETQIHRLNGQVGMMWRDWAIERGVDPDVLPDPQPSPKEQP